MSYQNPVIPGFHPDPSVCRVGSDYYLVNSTFEYFPGVPIWHSRDLVNWEQIGNVLTRQSQLDLNDCPCSDGIYAPTIRHHNGVFHIITTLVKSGSFTNFVVTATNPAGPWSDPVIIDQSGIDPSLLFAADGKVYFQSNRGMVFSDERAIYQSEINLETGARIKGPELIWHGTGGSYVEGPHLYERSGYYYLLAAEGGTSYGHMVTISRSRNIWGPFENCPHNPILSNRHAYEDIHGTGHADLIEAHDGSWWMVHLAFRQTIGSVHTLGRETCLTPVEWMDDWPVAIKTGTTSAEMVGHGLPQKPWSEPPARDDFDSSALSPNWIHIRNPVSSNYSLSERKGFLRLRGSVVTLNDLNSPTLVARRQQHFDFEVAAHLHFEPSGAGEEAGLTMMMTNEHHFEICVCQKEGRRVLLVKYKLELIHQTAAEIPLDSGPLTLSIQGCKQFYRFGFKKDGDTFHEIAKVNTRYLATEVTGGYNGVVIGMYAVGNGSPLNNPADFDWFEYQPRQEVSP